MPNKDDNKPFTYQRGKVKYTGRTDSDRKSVRIDTVLYWVCKIILAIAFLVGVITKVKN